MKLRNYDIKTPQYNFLRDVRLQRRNVNTVLYDTGTIASLTLPTPCISESCNKVKINSNFYFHTSLWCLKRFYEGLKDLHKIFSGTTKISENKNLS